MAKWQIAKDFFCDYGHRVWTQELKEEFCAIGDTSCKCKHLHGHTGKITVEVGANELTRGFVTDFKHLGFVKNFVDEYLDHRFIMDSNDPLYESMTAGFAVTHNLVDYKDIYGVSLKRFEPRDPERVKIKTPVELSEYIESFTIVDFSPTSENLAKWICDFAQQKLGMEARVISVTWKETPKSQAIYAPKIY